MTQTLSSFAKPLAVQAEATILFHYPAGFASTIEIGINNPVAGAIHNADNYTG